MHTRPASRMEGDNEVVRLFMSCFSLFMVLRAINGEGEFIDNQSHGRIVYDQRQSGKFNIQVSIKDVAIIEVDQNEFDDQSSNGEDYYYDEEDLTVKPLPSWITKPTAVTTPKTTQEISNSSVSKPIINAANVSVQGEPILISPQIDSNDSKINSTNLSVTEAVSVLSINTSTSKWYSTNDDAKISNNLISSTTNSVSINSSANDVLSQAAASAVPHDKQRPQNRSQHKALDRWQKNAVHALPRSSNPENDAAKIYKIKIKRAHKEAPGMHRYSIHYHNASRKRCRSGQFLDENGACQTKRSSSILKKLFKMLVSLPLGSSDDAYDP